MKPSCFAYDAPATLAEALALVGAPRRARPLAGGQSLLPALARRDVRAGHLVDLAGVAGLGGVTSGGGWLRLGATTRQRDLERDPAVRAHAPLLALAAGGAGPVQVRTRATIGGALAQADPASEYPAVVLALGGEVEVAHAGGSRRVPAAEFFRGPGATAAGDGELVAALHLPPPAPGTGGAVEKVARRWGDRALAGAVVAVGGGAARVVLFGVGPVPRRARAAEEALLGGAPASEVAARATAGIAPPGDLHAAATTRARMAAAAVVRAVTRAREGARA